MTTVQSAPAVHGGGCISFFRYPATTTQPYKHITLYDAYRYISGTYARKQTELLRSILNAERVKQARQYKCSHFDFATFSGTFTTRRDDALIAHSGYLCLDFDHLDQAEFTDNSRSINGHSRLDKVRRLLLQDPHFETLLLFTSPSGNGLKWVIPIGNDQLPITPPYGGGAFAAGCEAHRVWFTAVRNYLAATYHLDADRACINISRCCFLPYDPDCYIAPRLHRELSALDAELGKEGALTDLATMLGATNIQISVNNQGDSIAAQTSDNHE